MSKSLALWRLARLYLIHLWLAKPGGAANNYLPVGVTRLVELGNAHFELAVDVTARR